MQLSAESRFNQHVEATWIKRYNSSLRASEEIAAIYGAKRLQVQHCHTCTCPFHVDVQNKEPFARCSTPIRKQQSADADKVACELKSAPMHAHPCSLA